MARDRPDLIRDAKVFRLSAPTASALARSDLNHLSQFRIRDTSGRKINVTLTVPRLGSGNPITGNRRVPRRGGANREAGVRDYKLTLRKQITIALANVSAVISFSVSLLFLRPFFPPIHLLPPSGQLKSRPPMGVA